MAKRNRVETPKSQEKWIKEGRGSGCGVDYKPWLTIQNVPSRGNSKRILGTKIPRKHDLLSNHERNYFLILEYRDSVIDIREQYPLLPLAETIAIAKELGIEHPIDPDSRDPKVMTTDFLITVRRGNKEYELARTIKQKDDLMYERVIEKFEIERRFWKQRDVDWGIVTENQINKVLAKNLLNLRGCYSILDMEGFKNISKRNQETLIQSFKKGVCGNQVIIRDFAHEFEDRMNLSTGVGLTIFKHLLITKQIVMDIETAELDFDSPREIYINEPSLSEVVME